MNAPKTEWISLTSTEVEEFEKVLNEEAAIGYSFNLRTDSTNARGVFKNLSKEEILESGKDSAKRLIRHL